MVSSIWKKGAKPHRLAPFVEKRDGRAMPLTCASLRQDFC